MQSCSWVHVRLDSIKSIMPVRHDAYGLLNDAISILSDRHGSESGKIEGKTDRAFAEKREAAR